MTETDVLLAVAQGLVALLVGVGAFAGRRVADDTRESQRLISALTERVVRNEAQVGGIARLEAKIDQLTEDVGSIRERVASWAGPRVS